MPRGFSVVAIIAAHNEADIIEQVVGDLIGQGVTVYFLDDRSSDGTVAAVSKYLGRGVIGIEHLRETFGVEQSSKFEWERILRRKSQIATELDADWFIHQDADEFRESPWSGLSLSEAIRRVDGGGFNAIDFASLDFRPVHDGFKPGDDVRETFTFYEPAKPYDRLQIRAWKNTGVVVDLATTGGHEAKFEGRKVFPVRFISRHYPIRGQSHGEQKVLRERAPRFLDSERARGWHLQYDEVVAARSFVRDPGSLRTYDPEAVRLDLMLRQRGVEDLETSLVQIETLRTEIDSLRQKLATRTEELQGTAERLDRRTGDLERLRDEFTRVTDLLGNETARNQELRRNLDQRVIDVEGARNAWHDLRRQLDQVYRSKSWRLTAPLRAIYSVTTGVPSPPLQAVDADERPSIRWGDLARLSPVSDVWGADRGLPVDRHYIHLFLDQYRSDIRGRVLEVKDSHYAKMFGGSLVQHVEVLDIDATNPNATIVADLTRADQVAGNQFDCFILTQTVHITYDIKSALEHAARLLKPGAVLLCTVPAVSRVNYENGGVESGDFWRLTRAAVERLFGEVFGSDQLIVSTHGNVRICAAFLYGLATEELDPRDLEFADPWFPLIHCVRAVKKRISERE